MWASGLSGRIRRQGYEASKVDLLKPRKCISLRISRTGVYSVQIGRLVGSLWAGGQLQHCGQHEKSDPIQPADETTIEVVERRGANMASIRQSRPCYGLGLQVKVIKPLLDVTSSHGSEYML